MPRSAPIASAVRSVSWRLRRADRDRDDLGRLARFLQPERLLDGDLVERVHRHLDVGEVDARAVGLDPDLDVVVDHPLDRDEDLPFRQQLLQGQASPRRGQRRPRLWWTLRRRAGPAKRRRPSGRRRGGVIAGVPARPWARLRPDRNRGPRGLSTQGRIRYPRRSGWPEARERPGGARRGRRRGRIGGRLRRTTRTAPARKSPEMREPGRVSSSDIGGIMALAAWKITQAPIAHIAFTFSGDGAEEDQHPQLDVWDEAAR